MIGVDTWKGVGYIMVILIAGIEAIPGEYYEAAAMDGASGWKFFRHITLPLLMPVSGRDDGTEPALRSQSV